MIYLTYNDLPSGIYYSQVTDVVNYLNSIQTKEKVRLVAFISIRGFFTNRKKIKDKLFYNKTSINENLNNQFPQFNSYLDLNDTKKNQCLIKKQSSLDDIFSN